MTQIVTDETVYAQRQYYLIAYRCQPIVEEWSSFPISRTIIRENPVDSRPKPSNLLTAMTGQQTQSTYRLTAGIVKNTSQRPDVQCDYPYPMVNVVGTTYPMPSKWGITPSTNWAMELRLAVKGRNVNLGNHLVEYRESANAFKKAADVLQDVYRCIRKRQCSGLRRRAKRAKSLKRASHNEASLWLTSQYAVMPVISDLAKYVEILNGRLDTKPIYHKVTAFSKAKSDVSVGDKVGMWEVSDRAIVYYKLLPEAPNGVTLGNPGEWLWEATPFSFVLDWVINVGDYLAALDALKGVQIVAGTVTNKARFYGVDHSTHSATGICQTPGTVSYEAHTRSVIYDIPLPSIRWDPSRSWRTVKNGLALLTVLRSSYR